MTTIGKLWTGAVAYVSLLVGAGLSVAGNLADTYRTRGADIDNLDKIMAAAWPILVILAIEMFVSPRWSPRPMFQVWRWVGCLAVGGMAMVVSWTHLHDLMSARGQLVVVAVLGPLAIDGMAIMATGLILSTRVRGHVATDVGDKIGAVMDTVATGQHYASGGHVRTGQTDNPSTDTYVRGPDPSVSADKPAGTVPDVGTDIRTGRDRWADLLEPDVDTVTVPMSTPVPADMASLNGMATWAEWTPADDRAVADLSADVDTLPKRTRTPAGRSYPAEFADYVQAWDQDVLPRPDFVWLTAGHFSVSTRTARRWLAAVLNEPVSAPPEGS